MLVFQLVLLRPSSEDENGMAHVYNPCTQKAEEGGSPLSSRLHRLPGQPQLL
ncbi:hypothetical protein I79_003680 [Cricetulus griseus]|uniref:Uncharacterized protein n=1 Tax=Cricetulus griseus TaxID=10029 RepID=G3H0L8_CRIGR|nr:hypothetical protein I79_003680 [Cricetulus griseus]